MTCCEYLELNPTELLEVLIDNYLYDVPQEINSPDDFISVSKMLSETCNQYSFLIQLSSAAKIKNDLQQEKRIKHKKRTLLIKKV